MRWNLSRLGRIDLGACVALAAMGLAVATLFAQPTPGAGNSKCNVNSPCGAANANGGAPCPSGTDPCCCRTTGAGWSCSCRTADECTNPPRGLRCNDGISEE